MTLDYRIIAPSEAVTLVEDPGGYVPHISLGTFRSIFDWITSRTKQWHARNSNEVVVQAGAGYILFRLQSAGLMEGRSDDGPRDDQTIVELWVSMRGQGDASLIAQCAAWLNAVILDCQTGKILTPDQRLREEPPFTSDDRA